MMPSIQTMPEVKADSSIELLLKAQVGDEDSLNELLARYVPRLERWASGKLWGLRTMSDTGDLIQDAIIKALPHLNKLEVRTEHAFMSYLQQAVKNRVIDLGKRASRRPKRTELPDPDDLPDRNRSALDIVIESEALERYKRALASLRKEERLAIMLRLDRGLGYEEIAAQLGKHSADAARMAVTRAIVRLADKMGRNR